MDAIIDKKLEEMQELDMTSSKDIIEILKLKNDMRTSELKLSIELAKATTPVHQTNIQNNYSDLLSRIMKEEG